MREVLHSAAHHLALKGWMKAWRAEAGCQEAISLHIYWRLVSSTYWSILASGNLLADGRSHQKVGTLRTQDPKMS